MPNLYRMALYGLLTVALAACATGVAPTAIPPTTESSTEIMESPTTEPTAEEMAEAATATPVEVTELPEWATLTLYDAVTGEEFTISDYAGKTVYVHLMATWCTSCLASQRRLRDEIIPEIDDENIVFISLDVQTQLDDSALATYAANNTFDWKFAVTSQDFMNKIVADFGRTASNPPNRPHFVIYPDGTNTGLLTGVMTTEEERAIIFNTEVEG